MSLARSMLKLVWVAMLCVPGRASEHEALGSERPLSSEALFDPARLLEVEIQIATNDWDKLRLEHHDLLAALGPTRLTNPEPKPYHRYRADVTINGITVTNVGVQKRGFLGSASAQRPSLGIKFDTFEDGKKFAGLKRISLNNNLQDPSQIHQVLAYALFAKAGVPAPRCSLARVKVNGKSLGIYSHVEAVEKPFLHRHFKDADGNLYEGQVSDFRRHWVKTFEQKNKGGTSRSDLQKVVDALQAPEEKVLDRVSAVVDVDEYLTYWAVETLIGHWDSYSNGGNNFFIYNNPRTGKFQFIPWGADSAFGDKDPFEREETPESVKARSILPHQLYKLPKTREQYRQRLREVIEKAWNEEDLLAEVDRLQRLLGGRGKLHVTPGQFRQALNKVREYIRNRRQVLEAELDGAAPEWKRPLPQSPFLQKAGSISATFVTEWREQRPWNPFSAGGTANIVMEENGSKKVFDTQVASAGTSEDARHAGCTVIVLTGLQPRKGEITMPIFLVQPEYYKAGTKIPIDGFTVGSVIIGGKILGLKFQLGGIVVGTLDLKEAGTEAGQRVSGRIKGDIYEISR